MLKDHPDIGISLCLYNAIDKDGKEIGIYNKYPVEHESLLFELLFQNIINHSSIMVRVTDPKIRGDIYQAHVVGEDYELWLRLVFKHGLRMRNIQEYLVSYRMHNQQISKMAVSHGMYNWQVGMLINMFNQQFPDVYGNDFNIQDYHDLKCMAATNFKGCEVRDKLRLKDKTLRLRTHYRRLNHLPMIQKANLIFEQASQIALDVQLNVRFKDLCTSV